ncbi:hypothetical protein K501DRAFT_242193 [Backusella circina FSU 941]|nr:hypothetical protein K501DRAFT_242193 [Backusella circina FSU 941]
MNQSKKGKEKTNDSYELKIIDDPLNYIPDIENEEYEAEFIVSHKVYKSKVINYVIKWKGWDHKDNTTEKASTIHADVPSLCRAYWSKMEPSQVLSNVVEFTKKDGGISAAASKNLEYRKKTYSNKHIRPLMAVNGFIFNPKWPNISTNWEADMKKITSVLPSVLDEKLLFGYIEWINGQRTVHFITDLHKHCPEKVISVQ